MPGHVPWAFVRYGEAGNDAPEYIDEQPVALATIMPVTEELRYEFYVRCFAATGACTRELEQRRCELRVLRTLLDVHKILLARNFLGAVFPVLDFGFLSFEGNHLKCLFAFLSGANVNAVAAAEAVEHANWLAEVHTLHCLRCKHFERFVP